MVLGIRIESITKKVESALRHGPLGGIIGDVVDELETP
jgi:hypothetical protein